MFGLILTSLGFIVPSVIALTHKRKKTGIACGVLTCTSVVFHGTHHPVAKWVDMSYVYCFTTLYVLKSIKNVIVRKRKRDISIHIGTLGCVLLYFRRCNHPAIPPRLQNRFHMLFHILAQTLLTMHAIDKK